LTLLDLEEISEILQQHSKAPEYRLAQKKLAFEVVKIIHGEEDALLSENITQFLFGENDKLALLKNLSSEEFENFVQEVGVLNFTGQNLFELFIES